MQTLLLSRLERRPLERLHAVEAADTRLNLLDAHEGVLGVLACRSLGLAQQLCARHVDKVHAHRVAGIGQVARGALALRSTQQARGHASTLAPLCNKRVQLLEDLLRCDGCLWLRRAWSSPWCFFWCLWQTKDVFVLGVVSHEVARDALVHRALVDKARLLSVHHQKQEGR